MRCTLVILCIFLQLFALCVFGAPTDCDWEGTPPENWFQLCNNTYLTCKDGLYQSPININTATVLYTRNYREIVVDLQPFTMNFTSPWSPTWPSTSHYLAYIHISRQFYEHHQWWTTTQAITSKCTPFFTERTRLQNAC